MKVEDFYSSLVGNGTTCFCGVPDSLLKSFCAYVTDNAQNHTITANEGNAIALAAGHYLATGKPAVVYMQNSGIGNCVNPLLSLTDEEVYNIPLLMLIGWRGEPDKKDEPQHVKQGKVTDKLLEAMGIEYEVLPEDSKKANNAVNKAYKYMEETKKPFAFIIKKGTFEEYKLINKKMSTYTLSRENAIETILKTLKPTDVVVSTTGQISREIYEIREKFSQEHKFDFLTVGSMGHASSIALGIALEKPRRKIYCFDGDGAALMHLGSLAVNASKNLNNFKHIIFNNEAHDSVGAQPTVMGNVDTVKLANSTGYKKAYTVKNQKELDKILKNFGTLKGTELLEVKVKCGARTDLGRPKEKPFENKKIFMENLNQVEYFSKDSISNLSEILKKNKTKKALVFTGKKSFEKIKSVITKELKGIKTKYYNNFSTNPKKNEIDTAIKSIKGDFDIIIAIGGGSVMDFAKAYRYFDKKRKGLKLIAIPTTAGTGAESTKFAVYYENNIKKSLDKDCVLPDIAILDGNLIKNCPKDVKIPTALDAFCHAIESYFSCGSTELSRKYAKEAMEICRDNIVEFVNKDDEKTALSMLKASNLAGKAINISRTTAAHAISYSITTNYKVPHGLAVGYNIGKVLEYNKRINKNNCQDARGVGFVKSRIAEIYDILGITNAESYFENLFKQFGIEIKNYKPDYIDPNRLKNNPTTGIEELFN